MKPLKDKFWSGADLKSFNQELSARAQLPVLPLIFLCPVLKICGAAVKHPVGSKRRPIMDGTYRSMRVTMVRGEVDELEARPCHFR